MLLYSERCTGVGLGPGRACLSQSRSGQLLRHASVFPLGKQLVFWRTKTDGGEINNLRIVR